MFTIVRDFFAKIPSKFQLKSQTVSKKKLGIFAVVAIFLLLIFAALVTFFQFTTIQNFFAPQEPKPTFSITLLQAESREKVSNVASQNTRLTSVVDFSNIPDNSLYTFEIIQSKNNLQSPIQSIDLQFSGQGSRSISVPSQLDLGEYIFKIVETESQNIVTQTDLKIE